MDKEIRANTVCTQKKIRRTYSKSAAIHESHILASVSLFLCFYGLASM